MFVQEMAEQAAPGQPLEPLARDTVLAVRQFQRSCLLSVAPTVVSQFDVAQHRCKVRIAVTMLLQ